MNQDLTHKELSESIIGAAMKVLNVLKPGLDEKLYERALIIELRKRGHKVETQHAFQVYYDRIRDIRGIGGKTLFRPSAHWDLRTPDGIPCRELI